MLDWPCSSPSSWRSRTDGSDTRRSGSERPISSLTVPGERSSKMRLRVIVAVRGVVVVGASVAFAAHAPEIDPATVPTGFFVAHNYVADVPVSRLRGR